MIWYMLCDIWYKVYDIRYMIYDMWYMIWYMLCNIWYNIWYMIWYYMVPYDVIYLTATGLTPSGSSTVCDTVNTVKCSWWWVKKHHPKHVEPTWNNKLIYIMHLVGCFHCCITMHGFMNVTYIHSIKLGGPGSSVGIATELWAGRSGDRIPVGARFSSPLQTGPGAYPASCTMGTGCFLGLKRPERDVDHTPTSSVVFNP